MYSRNSKPKLITSLPCPPLHDLLTSITINPFLHTHLILNSDGPVLKTSQERKKKTFASLSLLLPLKSKMASDDRLEQSKDAFLQLLSQLEDQDFHGFDSFVRSALGNPSTCMVWLIDCCCFRL
jgi:hypothetical protein